MEGWEFLSATRKDTNAGSINGLCLGSEFAPNEAAVKPRRSSHRGPYSQPF